MLDLIIRPIRYLATPKTLGISFSDAGDGIQNAIPIPVV